MPNNKIENRSGPDQFSCSPSYNLDGIPVWPWNHSLERSSIESGGTDQITPRIEALPSTPVIAFDNDRVSYKVPIQDFAKMIMYREVGQRNGVLAYADFGTAAEDAIQAPVLEQIRKNDTTDTDLLKSAIILGTGMAGGVTGIVIYLRSRKTSSFENGQNKLSPREKSRRDFCIAAAVGTAGVIFSALGIKEYLDTYQRNQKDKAELDRVSHLIETCDYPLKIDPSQKSKEVPQRTGLVAYKMNNLDLFLRARIGTFSKAECMGTTHLLKDYIPETVESYNNPAKTREDIMEREANYLIRLGLPKNQIIMRLESLWIDIGVTKLIRVSLDQQKSLIYFNPLVLPSMSGPNSVEPSNALRTDWCFDRVLFGMDVTPTTPYQKFAEHITSQATRVYQAAITSN